MSQHACPFCSPDASRLFYEGERVLGLWDGFPVNPGHALLVPRRHVADWFVADDDERTELLAAIEQAREAIVAQRKANGEPVPDGFNIGINVGAAAGQTVFHLHVHVIPRYAGDVDDPTGGVRHVIPDKANYRQPDRSETPADSDATARVLTALSDDEAAQDDDVHERVTREISGDVVRLALADVTQAGEARVNYLRDVYGRATHATPAPGAARAAAVTPRDLRDRTLQIDHPESPQRLVHGDDDPLLPELTRALAQAVRADIAVAFVKPSGVARLAEHLRDFLATTRPGALPPGRLRLLAGDYLELTDPAALRALGDLEGDVQLRIFETAGRPGFHPKAWIFHRQDGSGLAFVGSSNLSAPALTSAVEWNYRLVSSDESGFASVTWAFEALFAHAASRPLDNAWIDAYEKRRSLHLPPASAAPAASASVRPDLRPTVEDDADVDAELTELPQPHGVQREALDALAATRDAGNGAGLVVLATGLGKTWLAAFDSAGVHAEGERPATAPFKRVLFVAHREEILAQARTTFRRIRPSARFGAYSGKDKDAGADVLFASIQTLGRAQHLRKFERDAFDYIVVDEFHHAAARTYRQLIDYFTPRFLLGLTATPERTDGGDLLTLCDGNLVYRADLGRGIGDGLLCPFHYFGVPDEVDYANIPWRSARFDEQKLTDAVATKERAQNALEQLREHAPNSRALVFCCSQRHADFMASYLAIHGVAAASVHSGTSSAPRAESLEKLAEGKLSAVCAVDLFNEGVDIPEIDAVMMLRPTESAIVWLQQLGRGLRWRAGKQLTVIDYIGNHRTFLQKPLTLLAAFGLPTELTPDTLAAMQAGTLELPDGCFVKYETVVIDVLRQLTESRTGTRLRRFYEDFAAQHDRRPEALHAYRAGQDLRGARVEYGSWLEFVETQKGLGEDESAVVKAQREFLRALEITPMTRSFKMLVLLAMIDEGAFPGAIGIDQLVAAVERRARRNAHLAEELGDALKGAGALRKKLEKYPIPAWTGGEGTGKTSYFSYAKGVFASRAMESSEGEQAALAELTRELAVWRLAAYLEQKTGLYVLEVNHSKLDPILKPLERKANLGLPHGWANVQVNGETYQLSFQEIAVNVAHRPGGEDNVLAEILRGWFGEHAGHPGTDHRVVLRHGNGVWQMKPLESTGRLKPIDEDGNELDATYSIETLDGQKSIVFESRGGKKGAPDERNSQYRNGLLAVLRKLASEGAVLTDALVDSSETRKKGLGADERRIAIESWSYPVALGKVDGERLSALRDELCRGQASVSRAPGARGAGNTSKRIRVFIA